MKRANARDGVTAIHANTNGAAARATVMRHKRPAPGSLRSRCEAIRWPLEVIDNSPPIMKLIHALVGIQKGKGNENDRNLPDEGPAAKIRVRFVMAPFGGEIDKLPMHKDNGDFEKNKQ